MDWLRKIVSGKRNRFKNDTYNLDITYITNRVIAMSFPATGMEQMYRNSISDVRSFRILIQYLGCKLPQRKAWQEFPDI